MTEAFHPEDFLINSIVREWAQQGRRVEVLARVPSYPFGKVYRGYRNWLYQRDRFHGVPVHRMLVVPGYRESVALKILNYLVFVIAGTLIALVIGRRFDRIFIYQTGPLTVALPGVIAAKLYGAHVTIWTQDVWPDTVYAYGFRKTRLLEAFLSRLVRFVYANCHVIYVTCDGFRRRLAEYVPGREIVTVPNWPITHDLDSTAGVDDIRLPDGFNFTFTGNVGKVQNLENVILGFVEFRRRYPQAWLNIVGDGSQLAALQELVQRRGIEGVIFWGRRPLATMNSVYAQSNVLVCPLEDHPICALTVPLKFQTYLAAGRPVLGIAPGEVRDLIEEHGIGDTANPSDVSDIARAFERLIRLDDAERYRMGVQAARLLETKFNGRKAMAVLTAGAFGEDIIEQRA